MTRLLALALLMSAAAAQAAPVYKFVDQNGNVTYTNVPVPGAQPLALPPLSGPRGKPAPRNTDSTAPARPAASGQASDARVAPDVQKQRDGGRRQILEQELANEQKALADARQALADGKAVRNGDERNYAKYQERVKKLQDAVTDREKNIQALQQELAR